jgi:glycosyltransferase involved in cell wall biosynthesis
MAVVDAGDFDRMISLVIPVFNEEGNLPVLMGRILPVMSGLKRPWEVILVDDGSRDLSLEILRGFTIHPEVRVVELTRNYGQHAAILAGWNNPKREKRFPAQDPSLADRQYGGAKNHRRPDDRLGMHAPGLPADCGKADDRMS